MRLEILFACLMILKDGSCQVVTVGDKCPDIEITGVINSSSPKINLSQYRGKLVILDFWSVTCKTCLAAFPILDSLQNRFKDRVQFIAVNSESRARTEQFFKKMKTLKLPGFPFVVGDSILSKVFPRDFVPWHVWIDETGIVRYITEGHNATAEHLVDHFAGKELYMKQLSYDSVSKEKTRNIAIDSQDKKNLIYYSKLERCSYQKGSNKNVGIEDGKMMFSRKCASLLELLKDAFGEGDPARFNYKNSVLLFVKDSTRYVFPTNKNQIDSWKADNSYSYEISIPENLKKNIFAIVQQDLARLFNLTVAVEKRKKKCLALVAIGDINMLQTKGGLSKSNMFRQSAEPYRYMINSEFKELSRKLSVLTAHYTDLTFVDATGFIGNIDIQLTTEILNQFNLPLLKKELNKFNLDLIEMYLDADTLIINESGYMVESKQFPKNSLD